MKDFTFALGMASVAAMVGEFLYLITRPPRQADRRWPGWYAILFIVLVFLATLFFRISAGIQPEVLG